MIKTLEWRGLKKGRQRLWNFSHVSGIKEIAHEKELLHMTTLRSERKKGRSIEYMSKSSPALAKIILCLLCGVWLKF